MWATIECSEWLSLKLKFNGHDRTCWSAVDLKSRFSISADFADACVFKEGGVKIHRLFGLIVEPQVWGNFWQGFFCFCHDICLLGYWFVSRAKAWATVPPPAN